MDPRRLWMLSLLLLSVGCTTFHRSPVVYAQSLARPPATEPGTWTPTGSMTSVRTAHTLTLLPTGQALAAGGADGIFGGSSLASAELYDPTTGTWTSTTSMATARAGHTATLLTDGKVLVTGGSSYSDGNLITTAEIYDPVTQTWTPTGNLQTARAGHEAIRLADGRVLVVGGWAPHTEYALTSVEIYDPSSGLWSPTGALNFPRADPVPVLLPDGQVLVVDGLQCCPYTPYASVERFDPLTNTWTLVAPMSMARSVKAVVLLPSGKVLVAGGAVGVCCPYAGFTLTAELYDPTTDTWTPTGDMLYPGIAESVLLPNGNVLVVGGEDVFGSAFATAQVYDTQSGTWASAGSMQTARVVPAVLVLPTGNILVTGGMNQASNTVFASAELYTPAQPLPVGTGNLLTNASFELDRNGDVRPDDWTGNPAVARSQEQVRSGSYALQHRADLDSSYTIQQTVSDIQSGSPYALSGWVNVLPISDTTGFTLTLAVQWRNASGVITGTSTLLPITQTTEGWTHRAGIVTAPIGAATADVQMVAHSLQGPLYVDDLFFGNSLGNAGFEQDSDGDQRADGWQPTDLAIRTEVAVHGGTYALHLQGADDATYEVTSPPMLGLGAGERYHVSWAVNIPVGEDNFRLDMVVEWQDALGGLISLTRVHRYTASTAGAWAVMDESVTVPPGASRARLRLEVTSLTGSIYVDDLAVHFAGVAPLQRVHLPLVLH
jgi:hypothetical protein